MKTVAVIQCTAHDLYASKEPSDYCISVLKECGLFDHIVLAVAPIGEYKQFEALAKEWDVELFVGEKFNVAERIYQASKLYHPDIVVRVLLKRFYMDVDLVREMIEKLTLEKCDYINLDNEVNYEVAADVFSFSALEKAVGMLKKMPDDFETNCYRFSPWEMMVQLPDFNVKTLSYRKKWSKEKVRSIRKKLGELIGEEQNKQHVEIENPASRYIFAETFVQPGDVVLDIACGQGNGSLILSKRAKEVYGIDSNKEYIGKAEKEKKEQGVHYLCGTDETLESLTVLFDLAVSLHTLEHVDEDRLFLQRIRKRLKPNGRLFLEVPRLMPYPLGEPLVPSHQREYVREELEKMLDQNGFKIEKSYGGTRGNYCSIDKAREVVAYLCALK